MKKTISILGATGSVGTQALDVAQQQGFSVAALTAHLNSALLEQQIRAFRPRYAALWDEDAARDLRLRVKDTATTVYAGEEGVCFCAQAQADTVLNSIVGIAGLKPTLAALEAGRELALANKETLVAGGELVLRAAQEKNLRILPVDSEHSAIFQALQGCKNPAEVSRLILTASGGPFFGKTRAELENVTVEQALRHPNWSMGAKITVDSATMVNKGLELIEAAWLFGLPPEKIDVLVHRQSIVHSLVEYQDHSVIAQLGVPDMRVPIQYALTYPERTENMVEALDLAQCATLTFERPDEEAFPAIHLARQAFAQGGLYAAAFNGANEEANALFRQGKLRFLEITEQIGQVLAKLKPQQGHTLEDIFAVDKWAREQVRKTV